METKAILKIAGNNGYNGGSCVGVAHLTLRIVLVLIYLGTYLLRLYVLALRYYSPRCNACLG